MPPKQRGRPTMPVKPGERATVSLRIPSELKRRLDETAKMNERNLSQEIEMRLTRSFDRQSLLPEALTLRFDKKLAGIIYAVGLTIKLIGPVTRNRATYAFEKGDAKNAELISFEQAAWDESERTEHDAYRAAQLLLQLLLPGYGNADLRRALLSKPPADELFGEYGHVALSAVLVAVHGLSGQGDPEASSEWHEAGRLLGPETQKLLRLDPSETILDDSSKLSKDDE